MNHSKQRGFVLTSSLLMTLELLLSDLKDKSILTLDAMFSHNQVNHEPGAAEPPTGNTTLGLPMDSRLTNVSPTLRLSLLGSYTNMETQELKGKHGRK